MKIVFGLGNVGTKYFKTRHNIGFLFLDYLKQKFAFSEFSLKSNLKSYISEGFIGGEKILLVKPTTYMNLSGDSVSLLINYFKVDLSDIMIVFDDIDLSFQDVRFRSKGSAGTHNGMRDIILKLKDNNFARLKLGIEVEGRMSKLSDFVLSDFHKSELENLSKVFEEAFEVALDKFFKK
ncbi:aminoacyl-tRNA hydrolase [bacterium]|jgi:peptidyl-tRNA hydrolase, PTH1 family|nr:aminoacyl-tRNA hydrolase [bacterium]MBT6293747.1 aminoacyl-tRNA hydrolase [bacterium]